MNQGPLLLIVGMHRSGTSLLGSLLAACDIVLSGPLISGDTHNPEGYCERSDVTALQEQLLIDLERWWPAPRGMLPLPAGWLSTATGLQARKQLVALLERERHAEPWAIKDPRSSLLLPLWQAACQQLGIPLQLVLAVRDPAEVSVSLVKRDQALTGMDGWRALRLWWHHNAEVIRTGRDRPLQVLHYSHWFDPALGLQQLRALAPDRSDADLQSILASTVKPAHRRSHRQALPCRLAPAVQQFDRHLQRLAIQLGERKSVQQWLERQPELPALAPLPRRRSQLKRWFLPPRNRVATHPWGYVTEIVAGSQGPAAEQQLGLWLQHGFQCFELERFAALPGPLPTAQPWQASGKTVVIQLRGADVLSTLARFWLSQCPIPGHAAIEAVPLGTPQAPAIALNLADVTPGPQGGTELLQLAQLDRVWDPVPSRVNLLRQLGVKAFWLQAPSAMPSQTG